MRRWLLRMRVREKRNEWTCGVKLSALFLFFFVSFISQCSRLVVLKAYTGNGPGLCGYLVWKSAIAS